MAKYWDDSTREAYTFTEFCDICEAEGRASSDLLLKAFARIDVNNDGFITHDELSR